MESTLKKETTTEKETAYSYHTFLFPFIFEDIDFDSVEKKLNNCWIPFNTNDVNDCKHILYNDKRILYNENQYFHHCVRSALYMDNEKVVKNYIYKFTSSSTYSIKKGELTYSLDVIAIRLNLYNTGVAVLIFELENNTHRSIDDVLKINEYGRRIFIPYISNENSCSLIADKIELKGIEECDFTEKLKNYSKLKAEFDNFSPIISRLLGDNFNFEQKATNEIKCVPIIDDRMFVVSCVNDNNFIKTFAIWDNEKKCYAWERDCIEKPYYEQSKLYQYVFIDTGDVTCIDRNMRLSLLKDCLYTRWCEYNPELEFPYGTIYGITNHSFVAAINWDGGEIQFLTMYTQMAILTLVQRASLISLTRYAAKFSPKFNKNRRLSSKDIRNIQKLQERYVAFQNQLLFFEVTPQEQGIELYQLLHKALYISDEKEKLESQLHNLYEISESNQSQKLNNIILCLTILSIGLGVFQIVMDLFFNKIRSIQALLHFLYKSKELFLLSFSLVPIILVIILIYNKLKK